MNEIELEENLARVRAVITDAAARAERDPLTVRLVPASKHVPPETLRLAYGAGLRVFGENRVQEARAKQPLLPADIEWHFIGGLQKNKARDATRLFALIHSVDSVELAQELDRRAREAGKVQRVLIEVNVGGEASKHGASPPAVPALADAIFACDNLELRGLMTVAPFCEEVSKVRPFFRRLRELRDDLERDAGAKFPELSMGMSHDFAAAVEEGATIVRVGTALFGARHDKKAEAN
ncbi:MAG: YggS family pyridoxal phosphate-dependent enzyme [Verrucomicrobiales bacterium]|jgi:pyridoxal phosphate enzyme (YggS family)|nr:YggS family pyridoxal phosphate-dependent enzyme [Verrucomicrobiales bacterium]